MYFWKKNGAAIRFLGIPTVLDVCCTAFRVAFFPYVKLPQGLRFSLHPIPYLLHSVGCQSPRLPLTHLFPPPLPEFHHSRHKSVSPDLKEGRAHQFLCYQIWNGPSHQKLFFFFLQVH